jgi:CheY-like chemotaxis protein
MNLANKRIFMVEDNLSNKAIAQLLLEREGARVQTDRWGVDAVERLRRLLPLDIILLDLMFPGLVTGYDIFRRIREVPELDRIPVVAVSASDAPVAIATTRKMGFAGFIGKPLDFTLFPMQIQQIIEGESVWYTPDSRYRGNS